MNALNMRFPTTFLLVALLVGAPAAQAQDHREEIVAAVIDRCILATIRYKLLEARLTQPVVIAEAAMLEDLRRAEHTERLIASLAKLVEGKDREQRSALYDIAYVECFLSGVAAD